MAKVIMINPDRCTGCRNCELACSFAHEGEFRPRASRIHVYTWDRESVSVPMMCQHCESAACVAVCPTGAMHRNPVDGTVDWDATRCIRCRMCTLACPFGNVVYDSRSSSILKCDMCGGDPECVKFCPNEALQYVDDTLATRSRKKAYSSKFKEAFAEVK